MFKKGDVVKGGKFSDPTFLMISENEKEDIYSLVCVKRGEGINYSPGDYHPLVFLSPTLWDVSSFEELAKFEKNIENNYIPKLEWVEIDGVLCSSFKDLHFKIECNDGKYDGYIQIGNGFSYLMVIGKELEEAKNRCLDRLKYFFDELYDYKKEEIGVVDMPEPKEEWEDVFPLFIEMTKPENIDDILNKINEIATEYDNAHCGLPLYGLDQHKLMRYAFQEWVKSLFIDYKYG